MKYPSTKAKKEGMSYKLYAIILLCTLAIPGIGYSQPAPPGPGGGNPDSPLGVPFDDHLNLLLLMAGVVFAVVTLVKLQKKRVIIQQQ
jgi:hypothetical protein